MGLYYIQPKGELEIFYELNATSDISMTSASSVTSYPIESGANASDNVVIDPRKADLSGILTGVRQAGFRSITNTEEGHESHPEDYIRGLEQRINNRELFNIYATDSIDPMLNCIITSFKISQDNQTGYTSWKVSLSLQQIRTATRAQIDVVVDADFAELVANKTSSGANSADADGKQQAKTFINFTNSFSDETVKQTLEEGGEA